jgi:hypothetical protein
VYNERERDNRDTFCLKKNDFPPKKNEKKIKKCPVSRVQGWVALLPC